MRIIYKNLSAFARQLGFEIYGVPGSYIVGKRLGGGGYRGVQGPATNGENMAWLRGYQDGLPRKSDLDGICHEKHVPINIDSKTRERLSTYLLEKAPRGQGYSAFIEQALDAVGADPHWSEEVRNGND